MQTKTLLCGHCLSGKFRSAPSEYIAASAERFSRREL